VAWLAVGALVLHVAVKLPVVRSALGTALDSEPAAASPPAPGLSRRGLLRSAGVASVVAVVATAGSTVPLLRRVSVLGVRSGDGPGGVPINKSALAAGVTESARDAAYRLTVAYDGRETHLSLADLEGLPQATESLPIACVEGWSAQGVWTGVRMRDLLDLVDAPRGHALRVESLQQTGPFRATTLPAQFADDPVTLLALALGGERLTLDHGYPARVIAADRPGVLQTKWVTRIEVLG
jgi:DMSO/TMAO reductase YedYZ molybdopterin-dependent catalytic subunit